MRVRGYEDEYIFEGWGFRIWLGVGVNEVRIEFFVQLDFKKGLFFFLIRREKLFIGGFRMFGLGMFVLGSGQ